MPSSHRHRSPLIYVSSIPQPRHGRLSLRASLPHGVSRAVPRGGATHRAATQGETPASEERHAVDQPRVDDGPGEGALSPLTLRLFGPFEAQVQGGPLPRLRTCAPARASGFSPSWRCAPSPTMGHRAPSTAPGWPARSGPTVPRHSPSGVSARRWPPSAAPSERGRRPARRRGVRGSVGRGTGTRTRCSDRGGARRRRIASRQPSMMA